MAKPFLFWTPYDSVGGPGLLELGVMVSLTDFKRMEVPGASFSELLLFDGDLERITEQKIEAILHHAGHPVRFVHVQEFVAHNGRQELTDISSGSGRLRSLCVETVERTRDLAAELGGLQVVIHPGGIRRPSRDRFSLMSNLRRSLEELGPDKLLLENMPWYYWLRKSERMVSNICVSLEDMERFTDAVEGFTLDTCHGYLSKPEGDQAYCSRFLSRLGRATKHVHVSDARAPDQEGLQIGDGDIDFSFLRDVRVPVLVEIWKGHENGGAGFRLGIERLRTMEKTW
ncbi:MAG: sugar phosphate isomerase/epimerase family protein [Thermoplasmata archaeon]